MAACMILQNKRDLLGMLLALCSIGLMHGLVLPSPANAHRTAVGRLQARSRSSVLAASATLGSTAKCKQALVAACQSAPPNGVGASEAEVAAVEAAIQGLEPNCPPQPAQAPLSGVYELLFCTAKGGSNGKVGPFVGKVTQTFVDETTFINAVELFGGAVRISLFAEREVLDDTRIRVSFRETAAQLFGTELFRKAIDGSGVWVQRFVDDELRVMMTPSIFILRKQA